MDRFRQAKGTHIKIKARPIANCTFTARLKKISADLKFVIKGKRIFQSLNEALDK